MIVVGLDQALQQLGWAIMRSPTEITAGAAAFTKRRKEDRLEAVAYFVRELLGAISERPATVALEETWLGKNFATANKLAELRGALIEVAASQGFRVLRVRPRQWQCAAGIPMKADRKKVKAMSFAYARARLAGPRPVLLTEDAADAICIAAWAWGTETLADKSRHA